jgi:hypothetical protein
MTGALPATRTWFGSAYSAEGNQPYTTGLASRTAGSGANQNPTAYGRFPGKRSADPDRRINIMGFRKSTICIGKKSRQPVTEYDSQAEAQDGADHARLIHQSNLLPYRCDRCRLWHLAPKNRHTPSTTCHFCTGGNRRPKAAYATEEVARRRAEILGLERGIFLRAYLCRYGQGWHLTKS